MFSKFFCLGSEKLQEQVLCDVKDITCGEPKDFVLNDGKNKVVVVKTEDGSYCAVSPACTHYGAGLSKGIYGNGQIRCPWHGACFNVKTGDIEDSPGFDSLNTYRIDVVDGKLVLKFDPTKLSNRRSRPEVPKLVDSTGTFLIVGGGAAGLRCAEALRENGFLGNVIMVCKEGLPYDRPKLSKSLSSSAQSLQIRDQEFLTALKIAVITDEVVSVNTSNSEVTLASGNRISYTKLVIAVGGKAKVLECEGARFNNVFTLRTAEDANKIWAAAENADVVIIGASFIGTEVASALAKRAKSVSVLKRTGLPMANILGDQLAGALQQLHVSNGVKFIDCGSKLELVATNSDTVAGVRIDNGDPVPADVVVCGIGIKPATDFLRDSGIQLDANGYVIVNEFMQTSVENVFAAGDITLFKWPYNIQSHIIETANVQHWGYASTQGRIAAMNMLNKHKPLQSVPFFWTTQYGKSIRFGGFTQFTGFDKTQIVGSVEEGKFGALFYSKGHLVGAGSLNFDPFVAEVTSLLGSGTMLTDKDVRSIETYEVGFFKRWLNK